MAGAKISANSPGIEDQLVRNWHLRLMMGGWRSLLTIVAVLFLGVLAGYASLALGPVGWVLVFILTILVIRRLRRRPLGLGGYL